MKQEQQRTIRDTWQAWAKAACKAFLLVLVFDVTFNFFPVHTKRGIGKHVIETFTEQLVVGQGVAQFDAADVLVLDQHVAFTNGIRLRVQFLPKSTHDRTWVDLMHVFHACRQKATSACGWVINGANDAVFAQGFVVIGKHQCGGQTHNVTWGKVLTRCFIRAFCKLAD